MMLTLLDVVLLFFLAVTALAVVRLKDLFASVMLFAVYSLLSAALFVTLDAVDVAFTEAAVGAGISTILTLSTLAYTSRYEKSSSHTPLLPLFACLVIGAGLIYGTFDMPKFGDANAPIHQHVAPHYLNNSPAEIDVPNVVTAVLASYRGFDTFGEVVVVFTAAVGVLLLLGNVRRAKADVSTNIDVNDNIDSKEQDK